MRQPSEEKFIRLSPALTINQVTMDPTKKVLGLFCVTILLITVTAGPMRSEQRKLTDAFPYQQLDGRKYIILL